MKFSMNYLFKNYNRLKSVLLVIAVTLTQSLFANDFNFNIEAEATLISGNHEVFDHNNASAGAFVKAYVANEKANLEFNVNNVPSAGTYNLEILHFNGNTAQELDLYVNNSVQTVYLNPSNWAYQNPAKSTFIEVDLNEGNNTLKFQLTLSDIFLDKFIISSSDSNAFYVSNNGDDNNDGSIQNPWKTIAKVNTVVENNNNGGSLAPGAKILFKSGDTFVGQLIIKRSGTEANPIIISNYGTGELPIIKGSGDIEGGDYLEAIKIINSSYLNVTNLWVQNDRKNDTRYGNQEYQSFGIRVFTDKWGGITGNLHFSNLKISNVLGVIVPAANSSDFNTMKVAGIRLEATASEPDTEIAIKDVIIENNYFTNIGKAGVWSLHAGPSDDNNDCYNRNQNIIVRDNNFYYTGGSGVILSKTCNALIENNDFNHTGHSKNSEPRLIGRGSGAWVWSSRNIIAQFNRSYSVRGPNDSYGMHIDFGNKNIFFQYNYSEDSEGGFCEILGKNINSVYRFNVSVNDGFRNTKGNSIWVSNYAGSGNAVKSDENYIYNNTIYVNSSYNTNINYTPDIFINSENTYIYNNIFMTEGSSSIGASVTLNIDTNSELLVANNLFYGNIGQDLVDLDVSPVFTNPQFTSAGATNKDGYVLNSNSGAVDQGTTFIEPVFPMAGQGIFENISSLSLTDPFGISVDLENKIPNIGASNAFNTLSTSSKTVSLFNISPVPSKGQINLRLKSGSDQNVIEIIDLTGKKLYETKLQSNLLDHHIQIPNFIKNGIYLLKVSQGRKQQTKQFILFR